MQTQFIFMADHQNNPNISFGSQDSFELSDFFEFDDWIGEDPAFSTFCAGYNPQVPNYMNDEAVLSSAGKSITSNFIEGNIYGGGGGEGSGKEKKHREKVAFKTKSEIEILDDGFKWRKYGKKMVKNSPNPRNYYRCSVEACPVKKRVERDNEDPRYVVTTYEGIHNHQGPTK